MPPRAVLSSFDFYFGDLKLMPNSTKIRSYNRIIATLDQIRALLATKRLAIAGVSREPADFSRRLFGEFLRRGYDAVLLMTSPRATGQVVRDSAEAGVKQVWMYRASGTGAVSEEAVDYSKSRGIDVIAGECPMMFFGDTGFVHRIHGLIRKISGRYPRGSPECSCQGAH